jgi:branched-chain amino acid transport system ATP-binding protein
VLSNVLVPYGARHYAAGLAMLARYDSEMSRQPARQLLELTGLAAYGHAPAGTLPLGLLRRLEIARVLALDARVILLDESFSGLSPEEIGSQKKLVLALRQQGKAVVLIEHNMEIAMEICDRLSVLNFGRTLAEGTPAEIRNNPAVIEAYLGEG